MSMLSKLLSESGRSYGDRVKIHHPGSPFHGAKGHISGSESHGRGADNNYYRVKLDTPVKIGDTHVTSDLWTAKYLHSIK